MAVTINGTTGVAVPLGSASSPAETNTTSATTGIYYPTSTTLGLSTNGTNAVTIDASQNVGIGVSSTTRKLDVYTSASSSSNNTIRVWGYQAAFEVLNQGSTQNWYFGVQDASSNKLYIGRGSNAAQGISPSIAVDTSDNVMVGQTSFSSITVGVGINPAGLLNIAQNSSVSGGTGLQIYSTAASAYRFYVDMAGTIHATSTSITAISDVSLKTNVKPLETGLAEVMALQPRRFDWIDGNATNVVGFIAQEVESVLPDLVAPFKYNEEETKLGLKMGDMIPTLVKAIQELSAEVEALKAKVGA